MANTYARNFNVATNKAAKICGVEAAEVRKFYRNVKEAPKGVKRATIIAHKIMNGYNKPAVATEPAAEPEA